MKHPAIGFLPMLVAGLVFLAVIGVDRLRERFREPRPMPVVDNRTMRAALARVDRLDLTEPRHAVWAQALLTAVRCWLDRQIKTGPARRRARRTHQLDQVDARLDDLLVKMGLREPQPTAGEW